VPAHGVAQLRAAPAATGLNVLRQPGQLALRKPRALSCRAVFARGALLALVSVSSACSLQRYEAAALDREHEVASRAQQQLDDATLGQQLTRLGACSDWPPSSWTAAQLGLAAALRSAEVKEASAQVTTAGAGRVLAAQRANPTLGLTIEHHGDKDSGQSSHWSVGPSVEFSLSPQSRGRIAVALADVALVDARLEVLERAWQARDTALTAALDVIEQRALSELAEREGVARAAVVASARAQVAAGVDYAFEWQTLELEANDARLARLDQRHSAALAEAALAQALALPPSALAALDISSPLPDISLDFDSLKARALNQHPQVLRALADYDQAEHQLALAVAEQYPEVHLAPGYFFDQGDNVWSLVGGVVVPLFANHSAAIAQASAARDAAREHFYAVQSATIAALQSAFAEWQAALANQQATQDVARDIASSADALRAREQQGLVDKVVVARATLQQAEVATRLARSAAQARRARAVVEMAARAPLADAPFERYLTELYGDDGPSRETSP
jgi:hypothetical protein